MYPRIAECDREIEAQLERFDPAPNGKKRNQKNAPRFDVQGQLYRMTGVDLTRIDGVDGYTALMLSEIGTDMTKWPRPSTSRRLGLSPNNRITGQSHQDQGLRQPGRGGAASGGQRAAPDSALPRRKKAHLGAHGDSAQARSRCGTGVRGRWRQIESPERALRAAKRRAAQLGYQLPSDGKQQDTRLPLNPAAAAV